MFFLMTNTWCPKHVEDTKNWIKTFEKCAYRWFTLHNSIKTRGTTNIEPTKAVTIPVITDLLVTEWATVEEWIPNSCQET